MLAIKLLLTPILVGVMSLVGRRWGPAVSGWFVGLPLTSGPITLYLALDQGTAFAARAAQGTLRAGWLGGLLAGWCVFFASTFVLDQFSVPLFIAFAGVIAFLAIVLKLFPIYDGRSRVMPPPQWEVLLRMVTATAFVLALTAVSSLLGPQLSGLLTPFPIYATILGAFTHHFQAPPAPTPFLRRLQ